MKYTLKDICTKIGSGATPTGGKEAYKGGDYALVRSQNVLDYTFTTSGLAYINETQAKKLDGVKIESGDVLLNITGDSVARACIIPDEILPARVNQHVAIIRANNQYALNEYLLYFLQYNKQYLLSISQGGGTRSAITKKMIEDIEIDLPSIEDQLTIVNIINNISKKIEVNQQINDNLEQQASSILSDWTSTYPCRTYKLSDICKYVSAKCDTGNLTSQNYISTENMLPNKKGIVDASNIPTGKVTCFKVDDILIANIRPYFQKIWKADTSGGCSTDVLCIRSCVESHSPILYWILHQDAFFEYVMTGAKGCKMPRGDKQHIMNWTIDLPEPDYWADIATQLGAVDQRIAYNRIESNNLSNLRDTLLPKLMSGELKINEIDC